jgi:hypothetical protein
LALRPWLVPGTGRLRDWKQDWRVCLISFVGFGFFVLCAWAHPCSFNNEILIKSIDLGRFIYPEVCSNIHFVRIGRLAQLVERNIDVVDARGSSPLPPTNLVIPR